MRKTAHQLLTTWVKVQNVQNSKLKKLKSLTLQYSKTCVKLTENGFQDRYHLMQVKSIAECSMGSILQYC